MDWPWRSARAALDFRIDRGRVGDLHGYAHGQELPEAANPLAYGIGFVIATGLLHSVGIGIGVLTRWRTGVVAIRAVGVAVTALGAVFLRFALG